jgi:hypothetical protein
MKEYLPHQQRVVDEKTELDKKLEKLLPFLLSEIFKGLSSDEQDRLNLQSDIMQKYSQVLKERIEAFS